MNKFFTLPDEKNVSAVYHFLCGCMAEFPLTMRSIGSIEMIGNELFCENYSQDNIKFVQGLCSGFAMAKGIYE